MVIAKRDTDGYIDRTTHGTESSEMRRRQYRSLVVDDDPAVRTSLERTLPDYGIRVDLASDGLMAMNQLRRNRYDLVITDLRMPRMHGHRLIAEMMTLGNGPAVVVITSVAEPDLIHDVLQRGVADVVMKPLVVDVFGVKMRHLLDTRFSEAPERS